MSSQFEVPEPYYLPFNLELVVVIRDDGPMSICQSSPTYRDIHIRLNQDQINQLALTYTHHTPNGWQHEQIAQCFLQSII